MVVRLLNALLLIAAVVGGILAFPAGLEYRRLLVEHRRLQAEVGLLRVDDPDKVHVIALPTSEPWHFAWRVYLPAKYDPVWAINSDGGSSTSSAGSSDEPTQDVVRLRFRRIAGQWQKWTKTPNSSSFQTGIGGRTVEVLDDLSKGEVRQLGQSGVATFGRDQMVPLLTVMNKAAESTAKESSPKPVVHFRFATKKTWSQTRNP